MNELNVYFKERHDLDYVKIYLHNFLNIVLVRYQENEEIDLKRAIDIVKYCKKTIDLTKPVFSIIFPKDGSTVTEEARDYFGNDEFNQNRVKATSVVIKSLSHRITFNVYLKLNKPKSPIKAFNNLQNATYWLCEKGATDSL
jgi:hypothetical protein